MAAVSVVFPWSTCPIVPMLRCGLSRTYACLIMTVCSWFLLLDSLTRARMKHRAMRHPSPPGQGKRTGKGQRRAPSSDEAPDDSADADSADADSADEDSSARAA